MDEARVAEEFHLLARLTGAVEQHLEAGCFQRLAEAVEAQPAHQHRWIGWTANVGFFRCGGCSAKMISGVVYMPVEEQET